MNDPLAPLHSFNVASPTPEALACGLFGELSGDSLSADEIQAITVEHGQKIVALLIEQRQLQCQLENSIDTKKYEQAPESRAGRTLHELRQTFNGYIAAFGHEPATRLARLAHEIAEAAPLNLPDVQPTLF